MGLLAAYELRFRQLPLVDVAAALPDATVTVEVGQPNQAGPPPFDVEVRGADPETVEAALDDSAFVARYSRVAVSDRRLRVRITPAATMTEQLGPHVDRPERLRTLAEDDSILEHATVTPDGWRQRRWFADRETFDRYVSFWRRNADGFDLRRLREADGFGPTTAAGLTDRQLDALAAAQEMGYFEVPRRHSLGEVANSLGISASSLSERLRRAQAHLATRALEEADRYDAAIKDPQS